MITGLELQGRRAIHWWWYGTNSQATVQALRSRGPQDGWTVRVSHPRTHRFAASREGRYAHRVRDVLVAANDGGFEVRCTRYLCGLYTFQGVLFRDADEVCARCDLVHTKVIVVPVSRVASD